MQPSFFYKIAGKIEQLGKTEHDIITSEHSIRELYRGFERVTQRTGDDTFLKSIQVDNSQSRGLTVRINYRGIQFTLHAI